MCCQNIFPLKPEKPRTSATIQTNIWLMGRKSKEGLTIRCYLWLLNQPKYLTPYSDGSIASLEETGMLGTDFRLPDKALAVKESCGGLKYQSECKGYWIFFCLYVCRNADRLRWWRRGTPGPFGIDWENSMHVKYLITCLYTVQRLSVCSLDCGWSGVL